MKSLYENKTSNLGELLNTVVAGGYCIGCGACAALKGSPVKMKPDLYQKLTATVPPSADLAAYDGPYLEVCPFSDKSRNEDEISGEMYGSHARYDHKIGYHLGTYAGYVSEGNFRQQGSSGGMGTWMPYMLFDQGLIDGVIHIQASDPANSDGQALLFQYSLSTTAEQILHSAKSRYYPIELSAMLDVVRNRPGRYAVVGVPCFIKAIRLSAKQDSVLQDRIKFCIALICGHLKSAAFAQMLGWQNGIQPKELKKIDFRTKLAGHGANHYGVTVTGRVNGADKEVVSEPVNKLYGTDWGLGYFKYKACDYCDDVVGETADLTVGDAWLPQYLADEQGTNVIVVRNIVLQDILEKAISQKKLILDPISPADVAQSQQSGFEHRRAGLAYRLHLADQQGIWRPKKRVAADCKTLSATLKKRQKYRIQLAALSHISFEKAVRNDSFEQFRDEMEPLVKAYRLLYRKPLWERIQNKIKHLIIRT